MDYEVPYILVFYLSEKQNAYHDNCVWMLLLEAINILVNLEFNAYFYGVLDSKCISMW